MGWKYLNDKNQKRKDWESRLVAAMLPSLMADSMWDKAGPTGWQRIIPAKDSSPGAKGKQGQPKEQRKSHYLGPIPQDSW
jgi:hypothetical protein